MDIFHNKKSQAQFHFLPNLVLTFILIINLFGCQSVGRPLGWANLGAVELSQSVPPCAPSQGHALVCRNEENAVDVTISPIKSAGLLESWTKDQYEVLIVFSTPELPPASSEPLIPLFHFEGFTSPQIIFDKKKPRMLLSLLTNSLGLDLLGAAMMSPQGLAGALIDRESGSVYRLEAKLSRLGDAAGKVWLSKNASSILIESKVEYSTLWSIAFSNTTFANFELPAGKTKWIRLCDECSSHLNDIEYNVVGLPGVPQLSNWIKNH